MRMHMPIFGNITHKNKPYRQLVPVFENCQKNSISLHSTVQYGDDKIKKGERKIVNINK